MRKGQAGFLVNKKGDLKMKQKHMATHAIFSKHTGQRVGCQYSYTPEECMDNLNKKYFRFRNADEREKFDEYARMISKSKPLEFATV
jgi:hypothetical protein